MAAVGKERELKEQAVTHDRELRADAVRAAEAQSTGVSSTCSMQRGTRVFPCKAARMQAAGEVNHHDE